MAEKWFSEIDKVLDFKEDLECEENNVDVPLRYCANQSLCLEKISETGCSCGE